MTDPYDNRIGNGGLPQGIWGAANRAYTRDVQPNELVSNQLNQITDQNGSYIQQARQQAAALANARGLGNSSYAMGNAQGAAIRAALPIAQANAQSYQDAAGQNLQWLNQVGMNNANNNTSMTNASLAANTQSEIARNQELAALQRQRENLGYEGEQAGLNRAFQQYMGGINHNYDLQNMGAQNFFNQQNMAQQHDYGNQDWARNLWGNTLGQTLGTVLSSPDFFGDPQSAFGMVQGWGNYVGGMLNDYFGQGG